MTNSSFFPSSNFAEWSQLDRTDDHTPARRTATGKIEGRADLLGGGEGRIWSTAFWPSNREAHATGRWVALGTEGRRVQVAPFFRPFSHLLTQRWDAALAPGLACAQGTGFGGSATSGGSGGTSPSRRPAGVAVPSSTACAGLRFPSDAPVTPVLASPCTCSGRSGTAGGLAGRGGSGGRR